MQMIDVSTKRTTHKNRITTKKVQKKMRLFFVIIVVVVVVVVVVDVDVWIFCWSTNKYFMQNRIEIFNENVNNRFIFTVFLKLNL